MVTTLAGPDLPFSTFLQSTTSEAWVTDFGGGALNSNQAAREFLGSITALGRVGEADDIGGVIASMCTDEMGWINAERIEASGGMNL